MPEDYSLERVLELLEMYEHIPLSTTHDDIRDKLNSGPTQRMEDE